MAGGARRSSDFEPNDFDLSRYFKINFGIAVGAKSDGLITIDTGCTFFDEDRQAHLSINLGVQSPQAENSKIRVVTKVLAEKRGLENVSFATRDELDAIVLQAKTAAKDTFFNLATEETRAIMEVVNDASG